MKIQKALGKDLKKQRRAPLVQHSPPSLDFIRPLHLKEQFVPVHNLQDNEDHYAVAQCEQHGVPVAKVLRHAIEQRLRYAAEIHQFTNEIGRYGVAAETEQPVPPLCVAFDINPPIEQGKQQIAPAGTVECEARRPYTFHYGLPYACKRTHCHKNNANKQQPPCHQRTVGIAVLCQVAGKGTKRNGAAESEAAPQPCIVVPGSKLHRAIGGKQAAVAETAEHSLVHHCRKVTLRAPVAVQMHGHRVDDEQHNNGRHLLPGLQIQHHWHGEQIAHSNGLQGVAVYVHPVGIKGKDVALHQHSKQEQQSKALEDTPPHFQVTVQYPVLWQGVRHCNARHEEKERHDHIPHAHTLPPGVVELVEKRAVQCLAIELPERGNKDRLQCHKQKEVEAAQHIERE